MPKVPHDIVIQRETMAWELRSKGWTHARIAAELQLERSAVSKILKRVSRRASKTMMDEVVENKVFQLELLHRIIDEAMQSWEKSKEAEKTVTHKQDVPSKGGAQSGDTAEVTQRLQERVGDPRFLSQAIEAMAEVRKLLGLDAPSKLLQLDFNELTTEQLKALANGLDPFAVMNNG